MRISRRQSAIVAGVLAASAVHSGVHAQGRALATWHKVVIVNETGPKGGKTSRVVLDRWYPITKATKRPSGHWTRVTHPDARTTVRIEYPYWTPACSVGSWFPAAVRQWAPIVCLYAPAHHLSPDLVAAVIETESSGNPSVRSWTGAIGLMQLEPSTACSTQFGYCGDLTNPYENVAAGTAVLAYYQAVYGYVGGIEAYNCGSASVVCHAYAATVIARAAGSMS